MPSKYTIYLINPKLEFKHYATQEYLPKFLGKKIFCPPLSLPLIASLTPPQFDVKIIDEEMDNIPFEKIPDIVGITTTLPTIKRAFEIADHFKRAGATVVMGGLYATYYTDVALLHSDAVVVGEAEGAWEKLLEDYENKNLKTIYSSDSKTEYKKSPLPRWDLIDTDKVISLPVQASRGCPYRCEFCLVSKMFGNRFRYRDVDNVVSEIDSLPLKKIFFVDDNLTANKKFAFELATRLKGKGLSWVCQASIDVAEHDELLQTMADAGCYAIILGFESLNPASLKEAKKFHNKIEKFEKAIGIIHSHGIHVMASFIVGFDEDTEDIYQKILDFTLKNNLWFVLLSPLTAVKGTDLYDKIEKENRLLEIDPSCINGMVPNILPLKIPLTQFFEKYITTLEKLFEYETIHQKAISLFQNFDFSNEDTEDIKWFEKFQTTIFVLRRFLLTNNESKRKLFIELFKMARQKKIAPGKAISFLLSVEGIKDWFKYEKGKLLNALEELKLTSQ